MKRYEERTTSSKIARNEPFIIRLDGHKFSTFTRPFQKPFDERCMWGRRERRREGERRRGREKGEEEKERREGLIVVLVAAAMLKAAEQLLLHFNATSVYTCSDEITLVFPALTVISSLLSLSSLPLIFLI